jgi:hypothetical protein
LKTGQWRFYIFLFFILSYSAFCQVPTSIRVKKSDQKFYFYKKGEKTDTIQNGSLFYLIADDSLKRVMSIDIENGYLSKTSNDSLFTFTYIKGMKYECVFNKFNSNPGVKSRLEFKAFVNGVATQPATTILFSFKVNSRPEALLENTFYYKR